MSLNICDTIQTKLSEIDQALVSNAQRYKQMEREMTYSCDFHSEAVYIYKRGMSEGVSL